MAGAGNGVTVGSTRARTGKPGTQTRPKPHGPPRQPSTLPRGVSTEGEENAKLTADQRRSAPFTIAGMSVHDRAKQLFTISGMRTEDPVVVVGAGRAHFRLAELLELATLLRELRA